MIIVKEKKRENKSIFFIETYNEEGKLIHNEELNFETAIKKHINGITYLILYDKDMKPITEVFSFLNESLATSALNTRVKALNALRLLYIFEKIINKKLDSFNKVDIVYLKSFLRGISPKGQSISFEFKTIRNSETINSYLSVYRNYLTYLNITDSYLFKKSNKTAMIGLIDSDIDYKVESYMSNESMVKQNRTVPMYISVPDFKKILKEVRTNYSLCEECIIRLMFEAGLRLGEVLGLTGDDVVSEIIDNKKVFLVYIRNRFSDRKDQNAKRCMNINNRVQYKTTEYNTLNIGYQIVKISENLFNTINEYIEEAHSFALEYKSDNYKRYTIADRTKKVSKYEIDNYYIFLNTQGKPISYQTWNNRLRKIFSAVGIYTDKGVREHNLSHRFRHGFAMFQVQYMKMNALQLRLALRHKNLTSVQVYFRPTISDEIKIKTDFITDLYDIVPELNL